MTDTEDTTQAAWSTATYDPNSDRRLWILGASDPEMEQIQAVLEEHREEWRPATVVGVRVHSGNAGRADPVDAAGRRVVLVECRAPTPGAVDVAIVDHHGPGDPGYGRPPAEFFPASSLGQAVIHLAQCGVLTLCSPVLPWMVRGAPGDLIAPFQPPGADDPHWWIYMADNLIGMVLDEWVLSAAADHCLGAAYRGQCPGVDPDALMRWRATSRAAFQRRSVDAVLADVAAAMTAIDGAPWLLLGDDPEDRAAIVMDMRAPAPVPELPEAAARLGRSYISGPLVGPDGRRKYTCAGTAEAVRGFMRQWAPASGLTDVYGDPARGFAGGYLPCP